MKGIITDEDLRYADMHDKIQCWYSRKKDVKDPTILDYARENGLLVASRITVITIGKGCLLVEGIEHGAQWQCGVIGHLVERETVTVDIQWSDRCYDV